MGWNPNTIRRLNANDNPSEIEKYHAGKETLLQWFVGQVARATKGKADPVITKELMLKGLEERRK